MKRIKIDGTTVKIPESWDEITLGFYETWYQQQPATTREKVELAAEICCVAPELLLSARAGTFNRITHLLAFAFNNDVPDPSPTLKAKGVKYTVTASDELTLAQWVDADEAQRGGEKPLSSLLAIVCLPSGEKYDPSRFDQRQQLFASLKMSEALGVLGFFLFCNDKYPEHSKACLQTRQAVGLLLRDTKAFRPVGGGTKLSRIWRTIKFSTLMLLLRCRLRKFLRLSAT